ncbi:ferric reductase NAD binding domain-containing protein [Gymnopilus junonius]|uniref:ferric-chelate reductase (NADPH) n=1 Tax=Gymnopilus junonius TaxID=109634 RepID=A0A9P5NF63_GYMJU|nr:ferric reductase NAD binding domain-containing protein [Gymnopilus junonius]
MAAPAVTDSILRNARFISYPKQVAYLIASFIALVSLCHLISVAHRYATRKRVYSGKRTSASLSRIPPALVDSITALTMRWTIHIGSSYSLNLAEVGLVIGYIGVLLSWTFVNTTTLEGQLVDPHYYADRAGTIAASQLPLMVALGMKNNLISALTGIGFDKLNFLHRMSARTIVILAWIHGGGRVTLGSIGAFGWINAHSLVLLTIRPIRERSYELFLIIHFVLAFIFILTTYFHTAGMIMTYFGPWPSMIVWGLDRFLSMAKVVVFNFAYFNPWSKSSKALDANVEVLSHHFIKVTIRRPKYFYWRPGQSAYLSFPAVSSFPFESHPFTMSTIYDGSSADGNKLTFFLRVRKGFTARLMKAASQDQTYKVFVNGPYSSPPILVGYQSVMLFAGGSGVTFTLPLFLSLIKRAKQNEATCSKLTFVWVIRDADQIKWLEGVLSSAIEDLPATISVSIKLYVTSVLDDPETFEEDDSSKDSIEEEKMPSTGSSQDNSKLLESSLTSLDQGRPDVNALIQDEIMADTGPISINVCGTKSLAEAVRQAVRVPRPMDVLRGGPTISLHIEPFGL